MEVRGPRPFQAGGRKPLLAPPSLLTTLRIGPGSHWDTAALTTRLTELPCPSAPGRGRLCPPNKTPCSVTPASLPGSPSLCHGFEPQEAWVREGTWAIFPLSATLGTTALAGSVSCHGDSPHSVSWPPLPCPSPSTCSTWNACHLWLSPGCSALPWWVQDLPWLANLAWKPHTASSPGGWCPPHTQGTPGERHCRVQLRGHPGAWAF